MALTYELLASVVTAFVVHHGIFINGEWHVYASLIFFIHGILTCLIWVVKSFVEGGDIRTCLYETLAISTCYTTALFASVSTYRLLFHRLCGFPGPILARFSKLWHSYKCLGCQNHLLLNHLNREYGDFVRTGPQELTIFNADAIHVTTKFSSECTKSAWYDSLYPMKSVFTEREKKAHDERRRIWNRAFTPSALARYEERIQNNVRKLGNIISSLDSQREPVDITKLCSWFSFDVMGEFAFGKSFGMLENGAWHDKILMLREALLLLGPLSSVPWLTRLGFDLFPRLWRIGNFNDVIEFSHSAMNERVNVGVPGRDNERNDNGFTGNTGTQDMEWLSGDAVIVVIAGSETTGPMLAFTLYCLAKHSEEAEKLYNEVRHTNICDVKSLERLPYLTAVINETMRLYPAVPTGVTRNTPPEGVNVAGRYIPGNTTIVAPRFTIGRLERHYSRPHEFIPSRWTYEPDLVKDKKAFSPFSHGRYACAGKSIALMELRLVIVSLVQKFHVSLAPSETDNCVEDEMMDTFSAMPGKLWLDFKLRGLSS